MKKASLTPAEALAALASPDPKVRKKGAEALIEAPDPAALGPLVGLLADRDVWVRERSAQALGELRDRAAFEPLMDRLAQEKSTRAVGSVVSALGRLGDPRAQTALYEMFARAEFELTEYLTNALVRLGDAVVAQGITRLDDPERTIRQGAARVLGRLGNDEGFAALGATFRRTRGSGNDGYLCAALAERKEPRAIPFLAEAFCSPEEGAYKGAFTALFPFKEQADEALLAVLPHTEEPGLGHLALLLLNSRRDSPALDPRYSEIFLPILLRPGILLETLTRIVGLLEAHQQLARPSLAPLFGVIVRRLGEGFYQDRRLMARVLVQLRGSATPEDLAVLCGLLQDEKASEEAREVLLALGPAALLALAASLAQPSPAAAAIRELIAALSAAPVA